MKQSIIILLLGTGLLMACEKSVDFIGDNTTVTGVGSYPISANPLTEVASARTLTATLATATPRFVAGSNLSFELWYFSNTPIREINLYATVGAGARTKVFTKPYAPSFSAIKRSDTLLIPYTVPAATPSNTGIKLDFEILNENALSLVRSGWLRVQ
jgi:hypothetical protein